MPYKCPPAPLEVAFLIEAELRERGLREQGVDRTSARRSGARSRSRASRRWRRRSSAEKGIELHTFFNVEAIDRDRKIVVEPRGRGAALRPPDPRPAAQGPAVPDRLRARPGAGRLAAHRPRRPSSVGGRPDVFALGDATDLPLSKAGSTAHFEAPVVAERIAAAVEGREPTGKHADYHGRVMCFFEIGDGKGTLLQFDYDHPAAAADAEPALAPRQDRLQQDVLAHGSEGPRLTNPRPAPSRRGPTTRRPHRRVVGCPGVRRLRRDRGCAAGVALAGWRCRPARQIDVRLARLEAQRVAVIRMGDRDERLDPLPDRSARTARRRRTR